MMSIKPYISERFSTNVTSVRHFPRVYPSMTNQGRFLPEVLPTEGTCKRLFTRVYPHMVFKRELVSECPSTDITVIVPFLNFSVALLMVPEVASSFVCSSTCLTYKRILIIVRKHMLIEGRSDREPLTTHRTRERFLARVLPMMHPEFVSTIARICTHLARVSPLLSEMAMPSPDVILQLLSERTLEVAVVTTMAF